LRIFEPKAEEVREAGNNCVLRRRIIFTLREDEQMAEVEVSGTCTSHGKINAKIILVQNLQDSS
jgi:hypothetical protein